MTSVKRPVMLGVDIGGTSMRLALAHSPQRILAQRKVPTPSKESPQVVVETISRNARQLLDEVDGSSIAVVGSTAPGPVDFEQGRVRNSPHLTQFIDVPFRDLLEEELAVPAVVDNDCNAGVLAEHRFGCGRDARNMLYITVSTGIGGGILADGEVYRGAVGAAGEVGHMAVDPDGPECGCGSSGCWEALASGTAITCEAKRRVEAGEDTSLRQVYDLGRLDPKAVHEAARRGDKVGSEVLEGAAFYLGVGLAGIVNIFNPELIVLGGGVTQIGDDILKPAFQVCRERAFPLHAHGLRLEVTRLGDEVSMLGALAMAEELLEAG